MKNVGAGLGERDPPLSKAVSGEAGEANLFVRDLAVGRGNTRE